MKKITLLVCTLAYILMRTLLVNAQWQETNGPYGGGVITCLAVSGTNIFAGTEWGGVFLSTNNGLNWTQDTTGMGYMEVNSLAISGTNVFAGSDSGIFLSSNNGASWMEVENGLTSKHINSIAISGTNIFAGTPIGVFLSSDNGTSWIAVDSGLTNAGVGPMLANGTNVFAGTDSGVFLSTNSGSNWMAFNKGLMDSSDVISFALGGTNVFAATYSDGIFLFTDTGASWTTINNGLPINIYNIISLAVSGTNIFVGTVLGGVFLSANNGASWMNVSNGLSDSIITSLTISDTYIFAGTAYDAVSKRSLSNILAVENISADNSISIYPNPATNQLTIHASSLHSDKPASVFITNVLGQTVSQSSPSADGLNLQSSINISFLPAGIYFLQLKTESGSFSKMFVKE